MLRSSALHEEMIMGDFGFALGFVLFGLPLVSFFYLENTTIRA